MQWANAIVTAAFLVLQLFPFVLVVLGFRGKLDISRIVVAVVSVVLQALHSFADASAFGQRFTHINIWNGVIWQPLFHFQGVEFPPERVLSLALFAAILFATYRYILEAQARRMLLEGEVAGGARSRRFSSPMIFRRSRATPSPARIHRCLRLAATSSGDSQRRRLGHCCPGRCKRQRHQGRHERLNDCGVLRAEAGNHQPAELLGSLNRCLVGRMSGGFATGVVFRIDKDGTVTFANAGHLAPFLNGQEFPLEASLPLGLIAYSDYSEITMQMQPGDILTLYTDGVLEATNPDTKEMFGFERMSQLFASRPSAVEAARAAIAFGQDDDVTVLIITRLHAGEEGTTSVESSMLDIDKA